MKRHIAGLALSLVCALVPSRWVVADDFEYNLPAGSQMAEAMWDMMDWMRGERGGPFRFNSDSLPGMGNFAWPGMGMTGMPSYMDGMPMMNNFSDVYQSSPWSRLPDQFDRFQQPGGWAADQVPGRGDPEWNSDSRDAGSRLDGVWRGNSGETLMIEGDRFRLADAGGDYLDGRLQIRGDLVTTYVPITEQVKHYRYVKVGRMLMLRDDRDQTLVFERVYR